MSAVELAARFSITTSPGVLQDALLKQDLVAGDRLLAEEISENGEILPVESGEVLIEEGTIKDDVFFILAGSFELCIKGRLVDERRPGTQVGDYSVLDSDRVRTATLRATEPSVVLKLSMSNHRKLLQTNGDMALRFARQILRRTDHRNSMIRPANSVPIVFIISPSEQRNVVGVIASELRERGIQVRTWDDRTFLISDYPLESLERAMREADFTISIVTGDDVLVSRGSEHASPRDNVHIEYGMSVGAFGRKRSIVLYDTTTKPKLASDQTGLTYVSFVSESESTLSKTLSNAADQIAEHVQKLGPHRAL